MSHTEKDGAKNATPTKPQEISTMTHEEIEDLGKWASNFQRKSNGVSDLMMKKVDYICEQKEME